MLCGRHDFIWYSNRELLRQNFEENGIVVKRLSDTRWSARHDAVRVFTEGYPQIKNALGPVPQDSDHQPPESRHMAEHFSSQLDHMETVIRAHLCDAILDRFNATIKSVQQKTLNCHWWLN